MKKLLVFFLTLLIGANSLIAQVSTEEQTLLDNLKVAKNAKNLSELDYYKGYAKALLPLFAHYWSTGNYSQGVEISQEVLRMFELLVGRYDESYGDYQSYLGQMYLHMGKYDEAISTFLSMYDTYAHVEKFENPKFYTSNIGIMAACFSVAGKYAEAEKYALEAYELMKRFQVDDIYTAQPLGTLGTTYISLGQYNKAEKYMLKALSVCSKNDSGYGQYLNNTGLLYYRMGRYDKALDYFIQAYEVKKRFLPEKHPDHGSTLSNIGLTSHYAGQFAEAEKYLLQAIGLQKELQVNNPRPYANSLTNLGYIYSDMGDYDKALHYTLMGSELLGSIVGKDHLDYATSVFTIGKLHLSKGDYANAVLYGKKALTIQQNQDKKHPESVAVLIHIGKSYIMSKDYTNAQSLLNEAKDLAKQLQGEQHENYAEALYLLGLLHHKTKDFPQAEGYFLQSLERYGSILSTQHPKYAAVLNNLGELYQETYQYARAKECFSQAAQANKNQFVATTDYMSEHQRELYWETIRNRYESVYPNFAYISFNQMPDASGFAYDNELFMKGLLLHSSTAIQNSIMNSGDANLIKRWDNLKQMNTQILALQENDPTSNYLKELKTEAENLEKELIASSTIFRNNKDSWNITWNSVRQSLKPQQVAIEFFVTPTNTGDKKYCALLLRNSSKYPTLIPLCSEKDLEVIMQKNPAEIYTYTQYGKQLFTHIWKPLLKYIQEGEEIYFSPSGHLYQLAIEYLPIDEQTNLQEKYIIKRLSSTRELVTNKPHLSITNATLYGGILYDMDSEELLIESEEYQKNRFISRSVAKSSTRQGVQYLQGTKKEVDYINQLLRSNSIQTKLYVGGKGNEESFKALDGEKNHILHIATHGFFWSDEAAKSTDYYLQRMLNPTQKALPVDPLSRCGLLLAGANIALSGNQNNLPEGVQDGILTAKEISLLDLTHTQIAVLSACETGRGEVTAEGVFGLQRALKQAGVNTIIMSLWPVDDAATQLLMQEFYQQWITTNMNKHQAFTKAQKTVKAKYPSPEYWAGFILLD